MTKRELDQALKRMSPEERQFLRELVYKGTPSEVTIFVDLFHYFPGTHFADEPEPASAPPLPRKTGMLSPDEPLPF